MDTGHIKIFVNVVKEGSFSKAAKLLKLPPSSVSRAVAKLEADLGTKLLTRTTRSLVLTQSGHEFYDECSPAITSIEEAYKNILGKDQEVSGLVKITTPEDFGTSIITPVLSKLSLEYPLLNFEVLFTDDVVDITKEGFDIAVRMGKRKDSSLMLKQAGEMNLIIVANKKYLESKKHIKTPEDLNGHTCISHSWSKHWVLQSNNKIKKVAIKPKISGNHMTTILSFALDGCGIALVPEFLCKKFITTGELIRVLPKWNSPDINVSILSPSSSATSSRVKVATNAIFDAIKKSLSS